MSPTGVQGPHESVGFSRGDPYLADAVVGYESPSQFNRQFKRLFGNAPGGIIRMAASYSLPPPIAASV
jgi:hypothetical protein